MGCASVDRVLNALEHLAKDLDVESHLWTGLRTDLRLVRTFVLCARKYWRSSNRLISWESLGSFMRSIFLYFKSDENACLGSLLHSLEDAVNRLGRELDSIRLGVEERFYPRSHMKAYFIGMVEDFRGSLWSFTQKINESYSNITALGYSLQSRDELREFIDLLLANMEDLLDLGNVYLGTLISYIKEKLEFFKRFILFAELKGFQHGQLKVLLTHLELVAVNAAASVFFISTGRKRDVTVRGEMKTKISGVLAKVMSVEPQMLESYIKVLTATDWKRSSNILATNRRLLEHHVFFLLDSLDKLLCSDAVLIINFEEQIPLLYKGLRFLKNILMKYPEKFDGLHEKVKDLIRAAVNEAGIIICLLFLHHLKEDLAKEFDLGLFKFVGKIKLVKVVTSTFIFPRNNEIGFMDFLLDNLKELPSCEVDSIAIAKDQIQTIQEDLVSVRSFLEIRVEQGNQALRRRVMEVAHKTQLTVKSLFIGDIPDFRSPIIFDSIREELKEINLAKMEAMNICDNKYRLEAHSVSRTTNKVRVRLEDEATIIHKLTRGQKQLGFVSIVGMPGIGKTTLAQNVYNDPSIRCFFHIRAWCTVSQLYQHKDVLLQILSCMDPDLFDDNLQRKKHNSDDEYSKKNVDELEEKLRQRLMRNRYLIVLDDVWSSEVWNALERSFPDNANGSIILLTSRLPMLALEINQNVTIHHLQRLTDKESWELLQKKLPEEKGFPLAHSDLGMQIARHCQGLPLTIVTVAGILARLEKDDGWIEVAERLSLSAVCATDQCMDVLDLSYQHLPEYLKPCFLYFAAFPEDREIPSWRLMSLWIAEGFVQESEIKSLEDVAEEYIYELISRSLVMVSKERSLGGVRTCRIHDLLHEFCLVKAQKENFLQFLHGDDKLFTFDEPRNLQRLCIFSGQDIFADSRLCSTHVNSLMFYAQEDKILSSGFLPKFLFLFFKRLRVLDLGQFRLHGELPSEIELLSELRYLAIHLSANSIPSSVGNLSHLETFIVQADGNVLLPDTIWNLKKLRRLDARNGFTFNWAGENLGSLHNLDSISVLVLSSVQSEKILEKFPNIRRLKCRLFKYEECNGDCKEIVAMGFLSQLESLKLDHPRRYHLEFRFQLMNLKKLSLSYFHWREIPMIGKLCSLEVIKLDREISLQHTWNMEGFEFPQLKYLKLEQLRMSRWKCSSDQFPRLRKLVLVQCWRLKEVPSCFGEVSTLETIEVHGCSDSVVNSLREIDEEQKDSGNEDFQIVVRGRTNLQSTCVF